MYDEVRFDKKKVPATEFCLRVSRVPKVELTAELQGKLGYVVLVNPTPPTLHPPESCDNLPLV